LAIAEERTMSSFHSFSMTSITGETVEFSAFAGRFCLVVNVASR
jgi:glutathione peroxidase-family protein